jgi:hypothetical protein
MLPIYSWLSVLPADILSPDDNTLATVLADHSIELWDVSEPNLREILAEMKQRAET